MPVRRLVRRRVLRGRGAYRSRRSTVVRGRGAYRKRVIRGRGAYHSRAGFPRRYLHGRGSFFSDLWDGVKSVGRDVYSAVRRPLMNRAANMIMGLGDYKVSKNSIIDEGHDPPLIANSQRYNIFRHREYIGDITTSASAGAFTVQAFPINPGIPSTFPWFATLASNYVSYKPRGIVYEFKTTSSDALNSTNTALGEVIMATQTNPGAPAFANQTQMLNYDKVVATKPSCSILAPVECDPKYLPYKEFFVRTGSVPAGADQRLYDMGVFYIGSYGMQAASVVIGQLWVTYEFEMVTPILVGGAGKEIFSDFWQAQNGTTISTSYYFGKTIVPSSGNSLGLTLTGTTITFPAFISQGLYMLTMYWFGTAAAVTLPTITATSGCAILSVGTEGAPTPSDTSQHMIIQRIFQITAPSAVLTFSSGTLPTSPTTANLCVTQFDSDNGLNSLGTPTVLS